MKIRISALLDGELEDHEIAETFHALSRSEELRGQWCDCQVIGAALRGERRLDTDVAARVLSAIDLEPTVTTLTPRHMRRWQRPVLALAASAAGVAVVAWLALAPGGDDAPAATAELARMKPGPVVAQSPSTPRLREYLLAHQAYSPGGAIVGGARNIRAVAASDEGR